MVQLSLRKVGCLVGLLALVLLVVAFLALFTDVGRHGHAAYVRRHPDPLDVADLRRLSPHWHMGILDPAQKTELKEAYADIVQAYSNGQVEVLREWRWKLPERVESIRQDDFDDVGRQIQDIMYDELYQKLNKILGGKDIGEKYVDEADFERHADALIALALLYGDVLLRRKSFGGFFEHLEAYMFYRLKTYRDGFHAEGRVELEKAAERALAEWIDQIESENGYTRACLVKGIATYRVWGDKVMKENSLTWEEVSQGAVREHLHVLTWAGYTPKWIDEFKDIPRHATRSSGSMRTVLPISGSN